MGARLDQLPNLVERYYSFVDNRSVDRNLLQDSSCMPLVHQGVVVPLVYELFLQ
jgi:hypothetical protein